MSNELQNLIAWLQSDLTHFVAIVEEGSVVTGDPYQEGFSDHDLNIIVAADIKSEMRAVYDYLEAHPLGNEYLVGFRLAKEFATGDSLNDLSLKFRAKTLAGTDVVLAKASPSQNAASKIGRDGLSDLVKRFERRWLNLAQWTEDYTQKKNYELFKNFFVFASALHYGKTGIYPVKRFDVAKLLSDQTAADCILNVTNNIANASKHDQKLALESAFTLIDNLLNNH